MATKLSDAELAERVRARTQRNSTIYRQRKSESGKTQTLVWLPDTIRTQLDGISAARNLSLSAVTTELLSAALDTTTPAPDTATRASNDSTVDLFSEPKSYPQAVDKSESPAPTLATGERDQQILELHRQGLSNYAVAEKMECSEATIRRTLKRVKTLEVTE